MIQRDYYANHDPQKFDVNIAMLIGVRSADVFIRENIAASMNITLESLVNSVVTLKVYPHLIINCQSDKRAEQAYH